MGWEGSPDTCGNGLYDHARFWSTNPGQAKSVAFGLILSSNKRQTRQCKKKSRRDWVPVVSKRGSAGPESGKRNRRQKVTWREREGQWCAEENQKLCLWVCREKTWTIPGMGEILGPLQTCFFCKSAREQALRTLWICNALCDFAQRCLHRPDPRKTTPSES